MKSKYDFNWHRGFVGIYDNVGLKNYDKLNDVNFNPKLDEDFKKFENGRA